MYNIRLFDAITINMMVGMRASGDYLVIGSIEDRFEEVMAGYSDTDGGDIQCPSRTVFLVEMFIFGLRGC